jgi:choline transport protein
MLTTTLLNGALGLVAVLTFGFCISDVTMFLNPTTEYPLIHLFYTATRSKAAATAMSVILILLLLGACISALATASRQAFSLARDNGLPFSYIWKDVTRIGVEIPLNTVVLSLGVTILLAAINVGSKAAFSTILSLCISSIFTGYVISVGCVLFRRLQGWRLPQHQWNLGVFAVPITFLALMYSIFVLATSFFPRARSNLAPDTMNWAIVIWGAVLVFATGFYAITGKYFYREGRILRSRSFEIFSISRMS